MKEYEIEVPITTVARVTLKAENEEVAKQLAVSATESELHGSYNANKNNVSVYICDEYESYDVASVDEVEVVSEEEV